LFNFLKDLVWNTGKKFAQDNCPQLSASITYYIIFAIFPFLIFATGVVGLFIDESLRDDIVDAVLDNFPLSEEQGRDEVTAAIDAISGTNAQALGIIGLLGVLWTSSSMFNAIRRALNIIYREPEYSRPWVQQKVIDLLLVIGLAIFFTASVAVTTFLSIVQADSGEWSWLGDLVDDLGSFWILVSYAIAFIFSFIAFVVIYTLVPSRNRRLSNALVGAFVAALLFELAKNLFALYVRYFRDFDVIFGSLGAVFSFMFWVYVSTQIMLIGAEVAAVFGQLRMKKAVKQLKFDGFGIPLYVKAFRSVRNLFWRPPAESER
jgi:membrane protein